MSHCCFCWQLVFGLAIGDGSLSFTLVHLLVLIKSFAVKINKTGY
jgi:hypothetical protein